MATSGYAPVNGTQIYYEVAGEGYSLVLIHSLLFDTRLWDDVFPIFAQHYKTVRYDMRGFGKTAVENIDTPDTADLLGLLQYLGIEKTHLLGLSVGAGVAYEFTQEHPELISALVMSGEGVIGWESSEEADAEERAFNNAGLAGDYDKAIEIFTHLWVDGPVSPATPAVRERASEIMHDYSFVHWKSRAEKRKAAAEQAESGESTQEPEPASEEPAGPTYEEQLAALRVPTLFIAGDRDQPGVLKSVAASAVVAPSSEAAIIPGAAHIIPMEKPQEFASVVLDFLARRGGAEDGGTAGG